MLLLFSLLQLKAIDSFIGVRFSLMNSFISALRLSWSLLILLSFFLLSRAFLQCFLLTKQIIVFFDLKFLSVFPNRWQASISSDCILTTMSDKIKETVFSNRLSGVLCEIPDKTKLFLLPYCPKEFRFCSRVTTLFSKVLHFALSLSFSSWNRLITISFGLIIYSFKLLILLMIFSSGFISGSWLEALSLSETFLCPFLGL